MHDIRDRSRSSSPYISRHRNEGAAAQPGSDEVVDDVRAAEPAERREARSRSHHGRERYRSRSRHDRRRASSRDRHRDTDRHARRHDGNGHEHRHSRRNGRDSHHRDAHRYTRERDQNRYTDQGSHEQLSGGRDRGPRAAASDHMSPQHHQSGGRSAPAHGRMLPRADPVAGQAALDAHMKDPADRKRHHHARSSSRHGTTGSRSRRDDRDGRHEREDGRQRPQSEEVPADVVGVGDEDVPVWDQPAPAQHQKEGSIPVVDEVTAWDQAGSGNAADSVAPRDQEPPPWDQAAPAWDQAAHAWDQAAPVDDQAAPAWDQAASTWDQAAPARDKAGGRGKAERAESAQNLPGPPPRAAPSKPAPVPVRINVQGSYERAIDENDYQVPRGGYFFEHDDRDAQPAGPSRRAWLSSEERRPAPRRHTNSQDDRGRWEEGESEKWEQHGRRRPDRREESSHATHVRGRNFGVSEGIFGGSRSRMPDCRSGRSERRRGDHRADGSGRTGDFDSNGLGSGAEHRGPRKVRESAETRNFGSSGGFDSGSWKHDKYEELLKPPVEAEAALSAHHTA